MHMKPEVNFQMHSQAAQEAFQNLRISLPQKSDTEFVFSNKILSNEIHQARKLTNKITRLRRMDTG